MAQIPLNPAGGSAAKVQAKLPDTDLARLLALAARRKRTPSQITRELLKYALDHMELASTEPAAEAGIEDRTAQARMLRRAGRTGQEIASEIGVSRRTVVRYLGGMELADTGAA
jgi:CRP-like cAMP-binding protein